ncbi:MAG: A/G-specific adenine glycosylase [Bacteroidales bacterium]|nr:A/G-specific adenine glycosylase [Bacteroidales bacterium]
MTNFAQRLIHWYHLNKRSLPWRDTKDPYCIWLSEIILQQTRVDQGFAYYERFVSAWPGVAHLAAASEDEVLKMWQGLGYYSRARNLHKAAKQVLHDHAGSFPDTINGLLGLQGVGEYTAAAIASMAFGTKVAVVDGNVFRVLARLYGIGEPINTAQGKKVFTELATTLLPTSDAGTYNQALMEFGALHCTPRKPQCETCIFASSCHARRDNTVSYLPVKLSKKTIRKRYFNYLVLLHGHGNSASLYLNKRSEGDIWTGLYEFALIETAAPVASESLMESDRWKELTANSKGRLIHQSHQYKHPLTHQLIHARFYVVNLQNLLDLSGQNTLSLIKHSDLEKYPLPRLIDRFLDDTNGLSDYYQT